jgi:glycosyltransferase involved in cell wall biosynthesis
VSSTVTTAAVRSTAAGRRSPGRSGPCERWPSVTAIVATRDRRELLERAVRSILAQDYPGRVECLVVYDQCEPDGRPVVASREARAVRAIRNRRTAGLAGARNQGALAASGDLLAFCDDDDEWLPGKLRRQVQALQDRPGSVAVSCANVVRYAGRDIPRRAPRVAVEHRDLLRSRVAVIHSSTILVRRPQFLQEIGMIDEAIPGGASEDYEWQLRASRHGPILVVDEPLARIHWHEGSMFARQWGLYIAGLRYVLRKNPEFRTEPRGLSRILGQIAFGYAALGERRECLRTVRRCLAADWRQPRAYLSLLVICGLSAETPLRILHRSGRGV